MCGSKDNLSDAELDRTLFILREILIKDIYAGARVGAYTAFVKQNAKQKINYNSNHRSYDV